jgi:hypothetical protein
VAAGLVWRCDHFDLWLIGATSNAHVDTVEIPTSTQVLRRIVTDITVMRRYRRQGAKQNSTNSKASPMATATIPK